MSLKRFCFPSLAVLISLAIAGSAFAKDKKKDEGPDKKGGMMEEGEKDPALTETAEEGEFTPGKHKKEKKAEADAEIGAEAEAKPAEPEKKEPKVAKKTIGVFAEGLIGFGKAPVPGPPNAADTGSNDSTTGSATSFAFMLGGHYDFTPAFRLMLRVPWTIGNVKSAGNTASVNALGVPELAARLRLSDPGDTEWAVRLGVGVPIAQGNPDPNDARDAGGRGQANLQRVADAANGYHDPELYTMHRIPISPALLLTHHAGKLRLGGEFKGVFMVKVGGDVQPGTSGVGTLSAPGLAWSLLLGGNATYEVFSHFHAGLWAWARYGFTDAVEYNSSAESPTRLQIVLEPRVLAQFGRVVPSIGFVAPIGGPLGGDIYGLRVHVDVIF